MAEKTSAEKIAQLERENEVLKKENARLQRLLEEALRAVKRQAAPFSRQNPKAAPEKPGRKPSILQTCRQQLRSPSSILQELICATRPKPLDLTVSTR